ncbi:MAG: hypothetical protein U0353_06970 [Sandaracinus sp.]
MRFRIWIVGHFRTSTVWRVYSRQTRAWQQAQGCALLLDLCGASSVEIAVMTIATNAR